MAGGVGWFSVEPNLEHVVYKGARIVIHVEVANELVGQRISENEIPPGRSFRVVGATSSVRVSASIFAGNSSNVDQLSLSDEFLQVGEPGGGGIDVSDDQARAFTLELHVVVDYFELAVGPPAGFETELSASPSVDYVYGACAGLGDG